MLQDKIVVWIAGGSFGSADPRNYLSFGQQILGSEPGADVYLIGCRAKPDAPNTYPHIHEHCSSVVYSIVSEVAPDRLISRKAAKKKEDFNADPSSPGLIMGADDTGAHLLLSIMQYINALYKRHVDISTLLLVSPITHLHHTNYPSTKAHKHPEPIFYFPYSAVINEWIQYLFGKQDDDLSRLLQTSNHIAANIRFNSPEYLTLIKSGHELVRKREFRQSFYFDPVAIRTFDRFIRDPYIGLVFNSSQFLSSITNVGKIEVVTVMHSAIRDDALIFSDFLGQVRLKNGDKVHLSNEEFHAAFTGCIRFSNLFNSCPDLVKHVAKVIKFS